MRLICTSSVCVEKDPAFWLNIAASSISAGHVTSAVWFGEVGAEFRELVDAAVRDFAGRISFPGAVAHERVMREMQDPESALLLASATEVYPMSIIEASSCGLPIICRKFRGWQDVLGADFPYCFEAPEEALAAIGRVSESRIEAEHTAQRLFLERFRKDEAWYAHIERLAGTLPTP